MRNTDTYDWDYYSLLGVKPTASRDEIREAYHRMQAMVHPDKAGGNEKQREYSTTMSARVNTAWEILGDNALRREYDEYRSLQAGGPANASGAGWHESAERDVNDARWRGDARAGGNASRNARTAEEHANVEDDAKRWHSQGHDRAETHGWSGPRASAEDDAARWERRSYHEAGRKRPQRRSRVQGWDGKWYDSEYLVPRKKTGWAAALLMLLTFVGTTHGTMTVMAGAAMELDIAQIAWAIAQNIVMPMALIGGVLALFVRRGLRLLSRRGYALAILPAAMAGIWAGYRIAAIGLRTAGIDTGQ